MASIEISKRLIAINTTSSAISLIVNVSILLWLQQYLLRHIPPEEYSLIPIIISIMAFAPLLSNVLTGGMARYMTVAYARGDEEEVTRICSSMFPLLLIAGLILFLSGLMLALNIDSVLVIDPEYRFDAQIMLILMVFSTSLRLPITAFNSGFMVRQKLVWSDLIDIGCQFLRVGLLLFLLFEVSTRALWVTLALVISELVGMSITTPISMKLVPAQRFKFNMFQAALAKEISKFGGWWLIGSLSDVLKRAMDPLILNRFATAVDVTMYYVADMGPRLLTQVLTPITRPFYPILGAMYATKDFIKLRNTYTRTARYHTWVVMMIAVPAIIFSTQLMHLYLHGKYDKAGGVMAILLVVSVLGAMNALGSAVALAAGNMKGLSLRVIVVQLVNLILTVLFVIYLHKGAYGSAYATLAAFVLVEITLKWPFCWKIAHTRFEDWFKEVFQPTIYTAIPSIILCLLFLKFNPPETWFMLILYSAMSAILYILVVMIFGVRQQDKIDIFMLSHKAPYFLKSVLIHLSRGHGLDKNR
jgi:O-antigen/teichoic acid export membrane protein